MSAPSFSTAFNFKIYWPSLQEVQEGKDFNFPKQEEEILLFWEGIRAFEGQLERTKGKEPFVFYDGPPFATGLPHYGHLLAGTIKVRGKPSSALMEL